MARYILRNVSRTAVRVVELRGPEKWTSARDPSAMNPSRFWTIEYSPTRTPRLGRANLLSGVLGVIPYSVEYLSDTELRP